MRTAICLLALFLLYTVCDAKFTTTAMFQDPEYSPANVFYFNNKIYAVLEPNDIQKGTEKIVQLSGDAKVYNFRYAPSSSSSY